MKYLRFSVSRMMKFNYFIPGALTPITPYSATSPLYFIYLACKVRTICAYSVNTCEPHSKLLYIMYSIS